MILHPKELKEFRGKEVESLAAGHKTSCAILKNGEVYSWGQNTSGQLGLSLQGDIEPPKQMEAFHGQPRVAAAALGKSHSLFLDCKGSIWGTGENKHGQLGLGTVTEPLLQDIQGRSEWSILTAPSQMGMMAMSGTGQRLHQV